MCKFKGMDTQYWLKFLLVCSGVESTNMNIWPYTLTKYNENKLEFESTAPWLFVEQIFNQDDGTLTGFLIFFMEVPETIKISL